MSNQMIAGYHDLYWSAAGVAAASSVSIGSTGPDGLFLEATPHIQMITGDVLGPQTEVDGVFQGWSLIVQFVLQEVKLAAAKRFMNPIVTGPSSGDEDLAGLFGLPGTLLSGSYNGCLTAIPKAGTPAASWKTGDNGRRFWGCQVGPIRENLDTNPRFVPVTFRAFPFADSGTNKMWRWVAAHTTAGTSLGFP